MCVCVVRAWRVCVQPAGSAAQHTTVVGVEPTSGSTLQARKVAQVNLYLDPDMPWFPDNPSCTVCHPRVPQGVMYPLAWYAEVGNATRASADLVLEHLYPALAARRWLTLALCVAPRRAPRRLAPRAPRSASRGCCCCCCL